MTDIRDHRATFTAFTFTWAFFILMGMSSEKMGASVGGVMVTVTALAAIVAPHRTLALAACAFAYAVHFMVDEYRARFVHTWLDFVGSMLILLTLAQVLMNGGVYKIRERFVAIAGGPAVALAGVCFFAAGFSKLNVDFIDERLSCASAFYTYQASVPPYAALLPDGPMGRNLAIFGTLVMEMLGGLLWIHPRTRRFGIALAFPLMFMLGTNPLARLYVFIGPFFALLVLGFDWKRAGELWERVPVWAVRLLQIGIIVWVALAMTRGETRDHLATRHLTARIMVVPLMLGLGAAGLMLPVREVARPVWAKVGWAVVAFMVAFESLPYFGLNTPRNFTMAANFGISTRYSNHLVVRSALPFPGDHEEWRKWLGAGRGVQSPRVLNCGKLRYQETPEQREARAKGITRQ